MSDSAIPLDDASTARGRVVELEAQLATERELRAQLERKHDLLLGAYAALAPPLTTEQKIEQHLSAAAAPLTIAELRKLCRTRNATLTTTLAALVAAGRIHRDAAGYAITR